VPGLIGMALGLFAGAFGAAVLWGTVKIMRDATSLGKTGIFLTLIGFLLKFPLLGFAGWLAYKQSAGALGCFLAGVLVVYSALVWRALRSDLF
jgi:hypothetical protein